MNKPRSTNLRVLVCGGRNYADSGTLKATLDKVHRLRTIACVIHGAARGADSLADSWAATADVPREPFKADWDTHGKAAGFKRNEEMLRFGRPDVVIAFPGGNGTAHMVKIAREAGVPVWEPAA